MEGAKSRAALLGCSAKLSGPQDQEVSRYKTRSFAHTHDAGDAAADSFTPRPGEGVLSFFTAEELKKSVDEWRFPDASVSEDEGEQLVGREIMVDGLGLGKVTDFHDLTDFNRVEKRNNRKHKAWSSPHTVRFYENGMDAHGMERTVKLLRASEIQRLSEITHTLGHNKLQRFRAEFNPSHRAYMVKRKAIEITETAGDAAHESIATTDEDIGRIFKIVDKDGNGAISFSEFAAWLTRRQMATQGFITPGKLKEWQISWSKFDTDSSHTLSPAEFKKVMEDIVDKDWGEAVDPHTKRHYYYHKRTRETKWVKPSQNMEINDFLVRNGVKDHSDVGQQQRGPAMTINVQKAIQKLRVQPNYYKGRRNFFGFVVYLFLLMIWWQTIADINDGRGVETGLHDRINAIQFEVTPGPHFSQSIRATNWAGVRTLGDLHDLTLAMVENFYSDDDSTYFTPEDRVELKSNALQHVYRNSEFTKLWQAVGIDTDRGNLRRNCTNWIIADPSDGGFAGECEFFERCELDEAQRIVEALRGAGEAERFVRTKLECREQRCAHRYKLVDNTCGVNHSAEHVELTGCSNPGCKAKLRLANLWDSDCRDWMAVQHPTVTAGLISNCLLEIAASNEECSAIGSASGVELKLKCEARPGCKYWTELWRESCVSTAIYNSRKQRGSSRQRYNTEENAGLTNLHNHALPWLTLKMNRRKLSSCHVPAECPPMPCHTGSCSCPFPGYVPGTPDSPSATCPPGCYLTWGVAPKAASCTGTSTNSARCDLDPATNGTADCPPGCNFSASTPGTRETCTQSSTLSDSCLAAQNTADMCATGGVFANEIDYGEFIGDETGSVYTYDQRTGGFPFYIRLDDKYPQRWIGLLEVLRADRWLSHNTQDFTIECLTLNRNTRTLGFWSITYEIDLAGMIQKPFGLVVRSFPLDVADPEHRSWGQQILAVSVFICIVVDFLSEIRVFISVAVKELTQGINQFQIKASTQLVPPRQLALFAFFHSGLCLWMILSTYNFISGIPAVDLARIETDLVGYRFSGMVSDSTGDTCGSAGMLDPECEIGEKIELVTALTAGLESLLTYRNIWSTFCVYNAMRLLSKVYWARKYSVLLITMQRAAKQLGSFFLLLGVSGWIFSFMFHLSYGRRFFAFRDLESTTFALMAPILGGDSSLEAAVMESSRAGDTAMSLIMYWIYASYLIFLVYNVFIAIIVDGYEDAKDLDESRRNAEDIVKDVYAINELFDVMETHLVTVPESQKNVLYIKVRDVKVYSCGTEPMEPEAIEALAGYEFEVSIVQPWHGIPKVDPTNKRTTKATFTYLIKIERTKSPDYAPDGWPREFTLQALVRSKKRSGTRGEVWSDRVNSCWVHVAWAKKLCRSLKTGSNDVTFEEKWARDGLNYLELTLTDYINDKIDIHARNLILDGTLDHDEGVELEHHALTRELAATHCFITEKMKGLRKKAEAARSATIYRTDRSDPTLQKRLIQLETQMRRLKVIETLAATELSHQDLAEALSRPRHRMHPDGEMRYRPSVRCPKPLIKKMWKAFASTEEEDVDTVGPPATWKQMERLDDKLDAILNCEPSADTESTALPALVLKLNGLQEALSKVVPQLENLTVQVDALTSNGTRLDVPLAGNMEVAPPPPPPARTLATDGVHDSHTTAPIDAETLQLGSVRYPDQPLKSHDL